MQKLVTKETLQEMINTRSDDFVMHLVGRALVVVFKNQTKGEQEDNTTSEHNGMGFASCDAYSGSLTAKYYLKHGRLLDWQVKKWTTKGQTGYSRLTRYDKQLNKAAIAKKAT